MNSTTTTTTNATTTKTQKLLTAVLVLQLLTLLGQWTSQPGASAAIPDPGAQREAMVAQQKETNEKLDKLLKLLSSGDVKVKVESEK